MECEVFVWTATNTNSSFRDVLRTRPSKMNSSGSSALCLLHIVSRYNSADHIPLPFHIRQTNVFRAIVCVRDRVCEGCLTLVRSSERSSKPVFRTLRPQVGELTSPLPAFQPSSSAASATTRHRTRVTSSDTLGCTRARDPTHVDTVPIVPLN